MNFIKQNSKSKDLINLEMCKTIYKRESKAIGNETPFSIVFIFENNHEEWCYKTESEMESHFEIICNLTCITCIGDIDQI